MTKVTIFTILGLLIAGGVGFYIYFSMINSGPKTDILNTQADDVSPENKETMMIAGGCFWCVEADAEKIPGVIEAVSGYSGGDSENPTYEDYANGGHREVVQVEYDSTQASYRGIFEYLIKHMDPTDGEGSFGDRGVEYSPAIYYETEEEKAIAEEVLAETAERFEAELQVPVLAEERFWRAEDYHQDYYKKNPIRYSTYRKLSGRDSFVEEHWGDEADVLPEPPEGSATTASSTANASAQPWDNFTKPSEEELRAELTDEQYRITQEEGTETPFENAYWDNQENPGIYVDIVSGEPLFSTENQYHSGTGWPSFTTPLEPDNIELKEDRSLFVKRTEVVSKNADSHLGHVFNDGPTTAAESEGAEPTGLRYCLNSAALEFIPRDQLEERGYGQYLSEFENS